VLLGEEGGFLRPSIELLRGQGHSSRGVPKKLRVPQQVQLRPHLLLTLLLWMQFLPMSRPVLVPLLLLPQTALPVCRSRDSEVVAGEAGRGLMECTDLEQEGEEEEEVLGPRPSQQQTVLTVDNLIWSDGSVLAGKYSS